MPKYAPNKMPTSIIHVCAPVIGTAEVEKHSVSATVGATQGRNPWRNRSPGTPASCSLSTPAVDRDLAGRGRCGDGCGHR